MLFKKRFAAQEWLKTGYLKGAYVKTRKTYCVLFFPETVDTWFDIFSASLL